MGSGMTLPVSLVAVALTATTASAFHFPTCRNPPRDVCTTTTGGSGHCVDVHLCQAVLRDVVARGLYPKVCGFRRQPGGDKRGGFSHLEVCCPVESQGQQCGGAFPLGSGLEGVTTEVSDESKRLASFRRPPEQEVLWSLAAKTFPSLSWEARARHEEDMDTEPLHNGDLALEGEYPWVAALGKVTRTGKLYWFCGGSLISSKWVVTAAHCREVQAQVVRLGATDLVNDHEDSHEVDVWVRRFISHPLFQESEIYHDLALVELRQKVPITRVIQPICLPPPGQNIPPRSLLVSAGFGHLAFGGRKSNRLRKTRDLRMLGPKECESIYYRQNSTRLLLAKGMTPDLVCAHDKKHYSDPCQGDSGGGLMLPDQEGHLHVLVGVVAAGVGCGSRIYPGLYTAVEPHLEWIRKYVQE